MPQADKTGRRAAAPSLKGRALRYLSAREHSRAELTRKLAPYAETPEQLALVLDDLQANDFISEARVTESVIHRRAGRYGASRIKYELLNKGLATEVVAAAMAQLHETEHQRASEVWRRKFGTPAADAAAQARQMRFLLSRGFSAEAARRVLRQTQAENLAGDHDMTDGAFGH